MRIALHALSLVRFCLEQTTRIGFKIRADHSVMPANRSIREIDPAFTNERHRVLRMQSGELVRLDEKSQVSLLEVREGLIWLTGTPANGDILLERGNQLRLTDQWPFLVQALNDSEIALER